MEAESEDYAFLSPASRREAIEFATVCPSVRPFTLVFNYLCNPQSCLSRKNTFILSRRGTLELRVHWLLLECLKLEWEYSFLFYCSLYLSVKEI